MTRSDRIAFLGAHRVCVESSADLPVGDELERMRAVSFVADPGGRDRLRGGPAVTHVRVRPHRARYSDLATGHIVELGVEVA